MVGWVTGVDFASDVDSVSNSVTVTDGDTVIDSVVVRDSVVENSNVGFLYNFTCFTFIVGLFFLFVVRPRIVFTMLSGIQCPGIKDSTGLAINSNGSFSGFGHWDARVSVMVFSAKTYITLITES